MVHYTTNDNDFELTPEGEYNAEISSAEAKVVKDKIKIVVDFSYEDPTNMETKTHKEFVIPVVSSGDKFRVFSDLMALAGVKSEDEGEFDEAQLVGLKCKIKIGHSEWNKKTYANVLEVSPKESTPQ